MQSPNFENGSFSSSESQFYPSKPSSSNTLDNQRKLSEHTAPQKPNNQTLKFDTSQIRFFVDKAKISNFPPSKARNFKETPKTKNRQLVKGELEKITEKISEKLSEKYSSSKSSYSKPHSQDSKEESKILDQSNLKENDFCKKKTTVNPFEGLDLVDVLRNIKFIPF